MSLLSKAEVQYLQGQKVVSKSYEYKIKLIIKKKLAVFMDQELPLLNSLFPNLDLTKTSKVYPKKSSRVLGKPYLTDSGKDNKY